MLSNRASARSRWFRGHNEATAKCGERGFELLDADREQIREVLRDPNIFEKADGGLGVELDQNIDVARALALAARE